MVSDKEFVLAWQRAESLLEAAEAVGSDRLYTSLRASKLRKAGVPLKMFRRGRPPGSGKRVDVEALSALVK